MSRAKSSACALHPATVAPAAGSHQERSISLAPSSYRNASADFKGSAGLYARVLASARSYVSLRCRLRDSATDAERDASTSSRVSAGGSASPSASAHAATRAASESCSVDARSEMMRFRWKITNSGSSLMVNGSAPTALARKHRYVASDPFDSPSYRRSSARRNLNRVERAPFTSL